MGVGLLNPIVTAVYPCPLLARMFHRSPFDWVSLPSLLMQSSLAPHVCLPHPTCFPVHSPFYIAIPQAYFLLHPARSGVFLPGDDIMAPLEKHSEFWWPGSDFAGRG